MYQNYFLNAALNKTIYQFQYWIRTKAIIYDLLLSIAIYSLKNVNKCISKTKQVLLNKWSFSRFRTHFDGRTYRRIFKKAFYGNKLSYKKVKVSKVYISRFIFQETIAYKRQGCANLNPLPSMIRVKFVTGSAWW